MIKNLFFDLPLSPAQIDDFGVKSDDHYRALKALLLNDTRDNVQEQSIIELTANKFKELDEAIGNGEKLNALVEKYAPAYTEVVFFYTIWDEMRQLEDELNLFK